MSGRPNLPRVARSRHWPRLPASAAPSRLASAWCGVRFLRRLSDGGTHGHGFYTPALHTPAVNEAPLRAALVAVDPHVVLAEARDVVVFFDDRAVTAGAQVLIALHGSSTGAPSLVVVAPPPTGSVRTGADDGTVLIHSAIVQGRGAHRLILRAGSRIIDPRDGNYALGHQKWRDEVGGWWQTGCVLIHTVPGVRADHLLPTITSIKTSAQNGRGSGGNAVEALVKYAEWASESERLLRGLISSEDIERLLYTSAYRRCMDALSYVGNSSLSRVVHSMLGVEWQERIKVFEEIEQDLRKQSSAWGGAELVVFDTNVYIRHPAKFGEMDFSTMLELRGDVLLVIPMVVVDELDNLKQHSVELTRWRARYTSSYIDRLFGSFPDGQASLGVREQQVGLTNAPIHWSIGAKLLLDPPQHTRLVRPDDEIVDRTATLSAVTGKPITIVTYDTGMRIRAKVAGLECVLLKEELGEEPEVRESARKRRERQAVEKMNGQAIST
jgi:hypothetical protein